MYKPKRHVGKAGMAFGFVLKVLRLSTTRCYGNDDQAILSNTGI